VSATAVVVISILFITGAYFWRFKKERAIHIEHRSQDRWMGAKAKTVVNNMNRLSDLLMYISVSNGEVMP
jgi:uncharacterized membrane protein